MTVGTDRKGYCPGKRENYLKLTFKEKQLTMQCPGEVVLLDASFSNLSTRRVLPEAVLCQTQTFTAGGKVRTRRSKFAALSGRAVAAGNDERWDLLPLKIPAVTPTIANCCLIKVEYAIKVTI
jgi:hypothetical protein